MLGCGAHVRIIALPQIFGTVCAMCVRAAGFWACDVRSHFCTLFGTKQPNNAIIGSKKYSILERPFLFSNIISVLECHFLFSNIISYFRTSFPVLKHQKIVEKLLKKFKF